MIKPVTCVIKQCMVFPFPFRMLPNAEDKYKRGQIKLNFTIDFIIHVEKMQYYINNKVLVVKDSNEEGSKIKEFY